MSTSFATIPDDGTPLRVVVVGAGGMVRAWLNTVEQSPAVELAGIVVKRRTAGTYLSESASPLARRQRLKIITERVDALLAEARQMDIDLDALLELVHERDEAMQAASARQK